MSRLPETKQAVHLSLSCTLYSAIENVWSQEQVRFGNALPTESRFRHSSVIFVPCKEKRNENPRTMTRSRSMCMSCQSYYNGGSGDSTALL